MRGLKARLTVSMYLQMRTCGRSGSHRPRRTATGCLACSTVKGGVGQCFGWSLSILVICGVEASILRVPSSCFSKSGIGESRGGMNADPDAE